MHDFIDPELGKAIPYGIYGLSRNLGAGSRSASTRHRGLRGGRDPQLVGRSVNEPTPMLAGC